MINKNSQPESASDRSRALAVHLWLQETPRYLPPHELLDLKPYALAARKSHVGVWRSDSASFLVWDEDKQRHLSEFHWDFTEVPGQLGSSRMSGTAKPLWVIAGDFSGDAASVLSQALPALPRGEFLRRVEREYMPGTL